MKRRNRRDWEDRGYERYTGNWINERKREGRGAEFGAIGNKKDLIKGKERKEEGKRISAEGKPKETEAGNGLTVAV